MNGISALIKGPQRVPSSLLPCEDTGRREQSVPEKGPPQPLTTLAPDLRLPDSRTVTNNYVVEAAQIVVFCYGNPSKLIQIFITFMPRTKTVFWRVHKMSEKCKDW
ncbi:hypothetical protein, partial [Klebsiella pneumoniae]